MCFYIHSLHKEMKTAKRDIICYKNGFRIQNQNLFKPLYQIGYQYVLGELNKMDAPWPRINPRHRAISVGFHSYSNKKELDRDLCSVKCIIPKGAHYFYNPTNREYVSDQIIVQEFM